MYKKPISEPVFHIFTNNSDEWMTKKQGALKIYNQWKKDQGTARLYSTYWDKILGIWEDKDCLKSYGCFPN